MSNCARWIVVGVAWLAVAGCAAPEPDAGTDRGSVVSAGEGLHEEPDRLRTVMQAKQRHAHALVDAISLEDYGRIEQSARELAWLSRVGGWNIADTRAYRELSAEFRAVAEQIVTDARARDLSAVSADHQRLLASCLECHAYLRREGLVPGLPGPVTRNEPGCATALAWSEPGRAQN